MSALDTAQPGDLAEGFPSKGFSAMWAALSVSQLGSAVSAVTIPLIAAATLGASPGQMGLLAAMGMAPSFLVKVPAAALSDSLSISRVPIMMLCNIMQASMIAVVPVLWWSGGLNVPLLVAVVGGASLLQGIYSSLSSPLLVEVVPAQHLPAANGRMSATRSAADIGGPAVGGALLAALAAPVVVLVDAISFVLSALLLTRVPRVSPATPRQKDVGKSGWLALSAVLLKRSGLQAAITVAFVNGVTEAVLVLYLVRTLHMRPSAIAMLLSLGAVGGIVGGLLVGKLMAGLGPGRTLAIGTLATMTSLVVLPFAHSGITGAAGLVVLELAGSLGGTLMMATIFGLLQGTAPKRKVARVMALASTFLQLATVVGALAGGSLATHLPLRTTVGIAAALLVVALAPQLIRWRVARWAIDSQGGFQ